MLNLKENSLKDIFNYNEFKYPVIVDIIMSALSYFTHLMLCVATATHNFKWVKIADIYFI